MLDRIIDRCFVERKQVQVAIGDMSTLKRPGALTPGPSHDGLDRSGPLHPYSLSVALAYGDLPEHGLRFTTERADA